MIHISQSNSSPDMTGEYSSPGITGETITTTDLENVENYNAVTTPVETTPAVTTPAKPTPATTN